MTVILSSKEAIFPTQITMSRLIVFAGLPGTGKSSIARGLARKIGAVWLRVDSIEQAIRESGVVGGSLDDAGYRVAYAMALTLCTDREEHRRRVETRTSEVPGLVLPDWQATIGRDYHSWDRDHVTIDTACRSVAACIELVLAAL